VTNIRLLIPCLCAILLSGWAWAQHAGAEGGNKFPLPGDDLQEADAPASLPSKGSLAIRAVQGTPGAEPIGRTKVTVQLYHSGMLLDTIETQLDEHGVVMLEDLPVDSAFQPVAQVEYAGVTYSVVGELMDAEHPQQKLDVPCYEVTEETPPWKVRIRHLIVTPIAAGLTVTEVMVLQSSGVRSWLGTPRPDGKRTTTVFTLPAGATEVTLGQGFHDWCCSTLEDGKLVNHLPLMPGTTLMRYSYRIPVTDGAAAIDITAPAEVESMIVLLPADMKVQTQELEPGTMPGMGDPNAQTYVASNLAAGAKANLKLAGLRTTEIVTASGDQSGAAKVIAIVGGALVLLIAAVVLFRRPKNPVPA
jgi:hypothetical protein